jgi:ring-1,2-phenylacetyl-CoA epoxidase subunit PaaD
LNVAGSKFKNYFLVILFSRRGKVEIISKLNPAWTTEWLSEKTKEKLMKEGISPPTIGDRIVQCPLCKSENTKMVSAFGSTPCQSLYTCNECKEPFNYFKCH